MTVIIPCFRPITINNEINSYTFEAGWGKSLFLQPEVVPSYLEKSRKIPLSEGEKRAISQMYRNTSRQNQKKQSRQLIKWFAYEILQEDKDLDEEAWRHFEVLNKEDPTQKGKPYLIYQNEEIGNLSIAHSGDYFLFAYSENVGVGVDVEQLIESEDRGFINMVFSKKERDFILSKEDGLTKAQKKTLIWCLKEAITKALGVGFGLGYQSIEIVLDSVEEGVKVVIHHPQLSALFDTNRKMWLYYGVTDNYGQALCFIT